MTAKELVDICDSNKTCYDCEYDNLCEAYSEQFGFDLNCNPVNPKANSETKIISEV